MKPRIVTIYGTRPEAIKVAPVIRALEASSSVSSITVVTGQHREMLDQVNCVFGIEPDYDLDTFTHGQSLNALMAKVFDRLDPLLEEIRPDAVLVQGDTSTVAAAAISSFYRKVPVFHLEAGLRSGDINTPFPEEANRKLTSQVSALHFAPTATSRANLLSDNVSAERIVVTGNTVIDALLHTVGQPAEFSDPRVRQASESGRPIVLVTTHRRENWGKAMERIGQALGRLAILFPDTHFVLPAHRNPAVRASLLPQVDGVKNIVVTEPLTYGEFVRIMAMSTVVLTDSGGVQEEAPSLGKPVLVMRDNTERPEAIQAGTVKLIGTEEDRIVEAVSILLEDYSAYSRMSRAVNPYGDGHAAQRVLAAIEAFFGIGRRLPDFAPLVARV